MIGDGGRLWVSGESREHFALLEDEEDAEAVSEVGDTEEDEGEGEGARKPVGEVGRVDAYEGLAGLPL